MSRNESTRQVFLKHDNYDSARESGHALPQRDVDEQTGQSGQARQPASQPTGDVTEKATSVNNVVIVR